MSVAVQDNEFFNKIKTGDWLVLFRVSTCYYCAQVADIIEKKIMPKYDGLGFIEVDQQLNNGIVEELNVIDFPSIHFYRDGELVYRDTKCKYLEDSKLEERLVNEVSQAYAANDIDTASNLVYEYLATCAPQASIYTTADEPERFEDIQFAGKDNILSVSIPPTVNMLNPSHFANCTSLFAIEVPSSLSSIPANAFYDCTQLSSVKLADSVQVIEDYAFAFCTKLEHINLHHDMVIGDYAFYGCTKLSKSQFAELSGITYGRKAMYD